jgi:hypothetical protein
MPRLSKFHWIVELKRSRKLHIVAGNEFDEPLSITLCGKRYESSDRVYAKKTKRATGEECNACLRVIFKAWLSLYEGWIRLGKSAEEAKRLTDDLLEIPPPRGATQD